MLPSLPRPSATVIIIQYLPSLVNYQFSFFERFFPGCALTGTESGAPLSQRRTNSAVFRRQLTVSDQPPDGGQVGDAAEVLLPELAGIDHQHDVACVACIDAFERSLILVRLGDADFR